MIIKIAALGEDLYKIADNDIPVDKQALEEIVKNSSVLFKDEEKFWYNLLNNKEVDLAVTADTGTVVDMYEVDYQPGATEKDIVLGIDPKTDLVSETVIPGTPVEKVNINVTSDKKGWRELFGLNVTAAAKEKHLEIQIISYTDEEGHPVNTIMHYRNADSGKWTYIVDADSGEQGGLADKIPDEVKKLLTEFGL